MKKLLPIFLISRTTLTGCTTMPNQKSAPIQAIKPTSGNIIRIFELVIKPEKLDEFHRLGSENIKNSVNSETGVLAMYVVADKEMPNKLYIVEAYADETAYQAHRNCAHFQAWANGAKEMIISRKVIETTPIIFGSKAVVAE